MKIRDLLAEGRSYEKDSKRRTQPVELDFVVQWFKKEYPNTKVDDSFRVVARGILYEGGYGFIQPSKHIRSSRNTSNLYTILMDGDSAWKAYPRRSRALVCSARSGRPSSSNWVISKKGAVYGVCPDDDLWWSFKKIQSTVGTMDSFNESIEDTYRRVTNQKLKINTYSQINKDLDNAFTVDNLKPIYSSLDALYKEFISSKHKRFSLYLKELLDPSKNNFALAKYPEINYDKNEVWTESDSILIKTVRWDTFAEAVNSSL